MIRGTEGLDVIVSRGGDDVIRGGAGNDMICSGPGDDQVHGGQGQETIKLGGGDDVAFGGPGSDNISGGFINGIAVDWYRSGINGGRGDDVIHGQRGVEVLRGGRGADRLYGGRGDDGGSTEDGPIGGLFGGPGGDLLFGGRGSDDLTGGGGDDLLRAGKGNDPFFDPGRGYEHPLSGGGGDDRIDGGPGSDWMCPRTGLDVPRQQLGYDVLTGGRGPDLFCVGPESPRLQLLRAGAGLDFLMIGQINAGERIPTEGARVSVDGELNDVIRFGVGQDQGQGRRRFNVGPGFEKIFGPFVGFTRITGSNRSETIKLRSRDGGVVYGRGGDDSIKGYFGPDTLHGNAGNDRLFGRHGPDALFGDRGIDECDGGTAGDTARGCETEIDIP